MKTLRQIKTLFIICAVAALIAAAHLYFEHPLIIQYGDWQAAPAVVVAAAAAVILLSALALILKLLSFILFLPMHMSNWKQERQRKNRQNTLSDGIRALAFGDHKQVLKYFSQLAEQEDTDGVYAWLAAEAAEKLGNNDKQNLWLRRAAANSSADIAAAANAKLADDDNRLSESFNILGSAGAPYGSTLLTKMYLDIAVRCQKWPQALAAAYRLRDNHRAPKWEKAAAEIARSGLQRIDDLEQLREFWKNNLSAADRKQSSLNAEYIHALHRLGDAKNVEEELERAAKTAAESPHLLSTIADLGNAKMCETLFAAEQKRASPPNNAEYLSAMAMLAERLSLWGKARRYYQMANSLRPDPRHTRALNALEEKIKSADDNFIKP